MPVVGYLQNIHFTVCMHVQYKGGGAHDGQRFISLQKTDEPLSE